MKNVTFAAATTGLLCSVCGANVLWDNGGMVTHPGAGAGGFDVSMASDGANAGANVLQQTTGDHYRIADDFTVSGTWLIDSITVHAYMPGSNSPGWTDGELRIWDGSPADTGSAVVATFSNPTIAQTNIYRVFHGTANLSSTHRLINAVTFDLANLELTSGGYWIDWQMVGGGGVAAWVSPVMEANPGDPNNPITPVGNAIQLSPGGWRPYLDSNETPFIVRGVPAPGAAATLAFAGLVGLRRRR